jgi:hypothetical protein
MKGERWRGERNRRPNRGGDQTSNELMGHPIPPLNGSDGSRRRRLGGPHRPTTSTDKCARF